MGTLYLVGTIHWDLEGPERLRKFLGFVRPNSICLESSDELVKKTLEDRVAIKAELERQEKFNTMTKGMYKASRKQEDTSEEEVALKFLEIVGYETWVSYEHQQVYPATLVKPVHDHLVLLSGQEIYKKGLGEGNIDQQGNFTPQFLDGIQGSDLLKIQEIIDKLYQKPDNFEGLSPEDTQYILSFTRKCDDVVEPKVREVITRDPNGIVVFVCGKRHFFGNYRNNLYERLKDLSPHRLRLSDVDKF